MAGSSRGSPSESIRCPNDRTTADRRVGAESNQRLSEGVRSSVEKNGKNPGPKARSLNLVQKRRRPRSLRSRSRPPLPPPPPRPPPKVPNSNCRSPPPLPPRRSPRTPTPFPKTCTCLEAWVRSFTFVIVFSSMLSLLPTQAAESQRVGKNRHQANSDDVG